jgi:hypothetical protein
MSIKHENMTLNDYPPVLNVTGFLNMKYDVYGMKTSGFMVLTKYGANCTVKAFKLAGAPLSG